MSNELIKLRESLPEQFEDDYAPELGVSYLKGVNGPGVYGSHQIEEALEQGHILIHPYNPEQLQGASYDVRLGGAIFRKSRSEKLYFDWTSNKEIEATHELEMPISHEELCESKGIPGFELMEPDDLVFWMEPGEEILAHTNEFIGINAPGTTSMHAKSFTGRILIEACKDAGLGDPGYRNRWTMEVKNNNKEPTALIVGMRIAQIVFHSAGSSRSYHESETSGSYDTELGVPDTVLNWRPESMLPRAKESNIR